MIQLASKMRLKCMLTLAIACIMECVCTLGEEPVSNDALDFKETLQVVDLEGRVEQDNEQLHDGPPLDS